MKRKLITILGAAILAAAVLTGCGKKETDEMTIRIAASAVPHAEILEEAKALLAEKGYTLEISVFEDYVQPNDVVEAGEFDANFFQHTPFMEEANEEKNMHLVAARSIHYEPLGLYPGSESDIANLPQEVTIAIPNDPTNEARALMLLQENGLIRLAEDAGLNATIHDIAENPYQITFVELVSAQIPRTLPEVSFGVLNGNYAMQAGLNVTEDAILMETRDSAATDTYVNIVAVKAGNESLPKIQALVETLKSQEIKDFIAEKYQGSVVAYE